MGHLALLKLLLTPKGNLSVGNENKGFYSYLLENISIILNAEDSLGVRLYICFNKEDATGNSEYQKVFIHSSNDNKKTKKSKKEEQLNGIINELFNKNSEINSIDDLYYYKYIDGLRFNAIRISSKNKHDKMNTEISWLLTYATNNKEVDNHINNLRSLLAIRQPLLVHLIKDFDNNLFGKYSELLYRVGKLSNPKSGSHTSFPELMSAFKGIWNNELYKDNESFPENEETKCKANIMHLISDSTISKWYVYNIEQKLPDLLPEDCRITSTSLEECTNLLLLSQYMYTSIHPGTAWANIKWIGLENKKILIDHPYDHEFLWFAAFFALVLNAVRHGKYYECGDKYIVDVEIKLTNVDGVNYFYFSNYMNSKIEDDNKGISLEALQYFFDSYYGKGLFVHYPDYDKEKFIVRIPCDDMRKKNNEV